MSVAHVCNKNRIISIILLSLIISCISISLVLAESFPEQVIDAKKGVFLIVVTDASGQAISTGSGFGVGEADQPVKYIVTNYHVIQGNPEGVNILVGKGNIMNLKVRYTDPVVDYAILEATQGLRNKIPLKISLSENVKDGQEVWALGFPGESLQFTDFLSSTPADVTALGGNISKFTQFGGIKYFQHDVQISHGSSGGPLVDKNGYVIGVNTLGFQNSGVKGSIYIDEIITGIEAVGIGYETGSGNDFRGKGSSIKWIVIYSVLGVGVIGLLVTMIVLLTQKNKSPAPSSVVVPNPNPSPIPTPAPTPYANQYQNPYPPNPGNGFQKPALYCIAGQHAGRNYSFTGSTLRLGRDPARCNVVFAQDAPGISAIHCEVSFDTMGNRFTLMDPGSTYGTFLASGEKLMNGSPYPLMSGDRFYLGNKSTMFEVRMER